MLSYYSYLLVILLFYVNRPVAQKNQVIEISALSPVPSQSALSGISSHGKPTNFIFNSVGLRLEGIQQKLLGMRTSI